MKKINKTIYIAIGIIAVVFLFVIVNIAVKNFRTTEPQTITQDDEIGHTKPAELPSKDELEKLRLENSVQTDVINEHFMLASHEIDGADMVYRYYEDTNIPGQTLVVRAKSKNIAEYELTLPVGDRVEKINADNYEMTFYNRMIYFVKDEKSEIPITIKNNIPNGHAEIRYNGGGSELVSAQTIYWYDSDNSIAYSMESLGRNYTKDEMAALASDYINNSKK